MRNEVNKSSRRSSRMRGFSMVELVVVLAVVLIITAISLPAFLQAFRTYQLNDAAGQVASVLKFTRYQAIRLNTPVSARVNPIGGAAPAQVVWTDANGNGTVQNTETQVQFPGNVTLIPPGNAPNTGRLAGAVGAGALAPVPLAGGVVTFDQRGALNPAAVDVFYIGNTAQANLGARAVILLPSGSVQIWTADAGGNWQQVN